MKKVPENLRQLGLSWDDLRYILALAKSGTLAQCAESMGISHTTVFRRIKHIETLLGARLFDRSKQGYTATVAAAVLIELAEHFDAEINRVALSLAGIDERPAGVVRVSTTDTLMHEVLCEVLVEFHQALPLVQLEVNSSNLIANLTKREADVCIRPGIDPQDHLIGKRLFAMESAIYAPASWKRVQLDAIGDHPWVGPDDSLSHLSSSRWMQERGLMSKLVVSSNSRLHIASAAKLGLGLAILPCYLGDKAPELVRVSRPMPEFQTELWILYHPEMRRVRRVQSTVDLLFKLLQKHRALFEGRQTRNKKH